MEPEGRERETETGSLADPLDRAAGPPPADELSDEELAEFVESEVRAHRAERRARAERA